MVFVTKSVNITLSNSGKNSLVAQYLETYTINRYREKENKAHHRQDSNQPTLNKLVDLLEDIAKNGPRSCLQSVYLSSFNSKR